MKQGSLNEQGLQGPHNCLCCAFLVYNAFGGICSVPFENHRHRPTALEHAAFSMQFLKHSLQDSLNNTISSRDLMCLEYSHLNHILTPSELNAELLFNKTSGNQHKHEETRHKQPLLDYKLLPNSIECLMILEILSPYLIPSHIRELIALENLAHKGHV